MSDWIARHPSLGRNALAGIIFLVILILVPGRMVWHLRGQYLYQAHLAQQQAQVLQGEIQEARLVQRDPAAFTQRLAQVKDQLPTTLSLPQLVDQLQQLCASQGVQLVQVTPPGDGQVFVAGYGTSLQPELLSIGVQGPLGSLLALDQRLQQQSPLFAVQQVSMDRGGPNGDYIQDIQFDAFLWNPGAST
jgi:hypothetical protein